MDINELIDSAIEVYKNKIIYEKTVKDYGGYGFYYEEKNLERAQKRFADALTAVINSVIEQRENNGH